MKTVFLLTLALASTTPRTLPLDYVHTTGATTYGCVVSDKVGLHCATQMPAAPSTEAETQARQVSTWRR